jgi:hypothetical protein
VNARSQLAGIKRFFSLHDTTLRVGILTGLALSGVFLTWLFAANRMPELERFAYARNVVAAAAVLVLMSLPVCRFLISPGQMFVTGILGWALASLCYFLLEIRFPRLENRMGALHLFMLGAIAYGFLSVLAWVVSILRLARRHPVAAARRRGP